MVLRIANGAGFLGDQLDAPRRLVEAAQVDFLTLEYLAELTMSILARQREKDPRAGYAADFLSVLRSLLPALRDQGQLRIVTNAGGVNPHHCAAAAGQLLESAGLGHVPIGVVAGDDLLPHLPELQSQGCPFAHADSGVPLSQCPGEVVAANAYLGARPLVDALQQQARIVITGRVADASLTVAPAVYHYGWSWDDYRCLAGASVAGHLIECGAQATGGFFPHWQALDLAEVGFPIVELDEDGACVITKPAPSGGKVDRETVCEQLVYEIGDPAHYLTPDVDVDFRHVTAQPVGPDRVRVQGANGGPPPPTLKVSLAYRDGYTASGQLLCYGPDCLLKAQRCAEIIVHRLQRAGCLPQRWHVEYLGAGCGVPGLEAPPHDLPEVVLRIAVHDLRPEVVHRFTREWAPLATTGPGGLAGYVTAAGSVRPVYAYWPTFVPRDAVRPEVEVRSARDWSAGVPAAAGVANYQRETRPSPVAAHEPIAVPHLPALRPTPAPRASANTIRLEQIAHARSGDKGNHANLGVVAYTPAGYAYLCAHLTPQRVQEYFSGLGATRVERYELPGIGALNFVLYDCLAGGASRSLRIDSQGKLLATAALQMPLPRPHNLALMERRG
jgi:hypothetical protein